MSKGNEPAFSPKREKSAWTMKWGGGLSKREYFAGLAMQGLISSSDEMTTRWDQILVAQCAVQHADALLAELEKSA